MMTSPYIAWFADISADDVARVGVKNAALGEAYRELRAAGGHGVEGFALTTDAYRAHLDAHGLRVHIAELLAALPEERASLMETGRAVRQILNAFELPGAVKAALVQAYRELGRRVGQRRPPVSVIASATAADLPCTSVPGQQDRFIDVEGEVDLVEAVRNCLACLFADRAIVHRDEQHIDHMDVALSVGVQCMLRNGRAGDGDPAPDTEAGTPGRLDV